MVRCRKEAKMVHIVVDLEMNWLGFKYENERKISTNEVIEIGPLP